jgi:capsular polysaccharide biosynthesis protein
MYNIKVQNTKEIKKGGNMEELDLKELFNIFWNKKIQIILIVAIFVVIGIVYTMGFVTPMYSSYTRLVLSTVENTSETTTSSSITTTDITLNSKLISTYSELVKGKNILRQVISNLDIDISEDELRKNITVEEVDGTELIKITAKSTNPSYAAQIANEVASVFMEKVKEIYKINNIQVVDEAEISTTPSNINHAKDVAIFALIGLVVAVGYVLLLNMLDTTVKTAEDIEKGFGIPVLVSIPLIESFENERGGKK